jgi:hypothetical protein
MDELKNNVGTNVQLIEAFISLMTELFTATGYTMNTMTRKYGKIDIVNPVVNWLAGTTESDLRGVLSRKLIDSGFTARVCFVFGEPDFTKRYPRIIYPPDYDEVMEHLQSRLWMLQSMGGRILMTDAAEAETDRWYMTRPNPEEEAMYSTWKRHHDMVLKYGMLNAIADGGPPVIRTGHVKKAKAMVRSTEMFTSRLLEVACETLETKPMNEVEAYLRKRGEVDHTTASRYFRTKRGMLAKRFRGAVLDLVQEGKVTFEKTKRGGTVYFWRG